MRPFALLCAVALWAAFGSPAAAQGSPDSLPPDCLSERSATIHAQFQKTGNDPLALKREFDESIKTIQSLSAGTGVTEMTVGGMNYFIQSAQNSAPYNGPALCLDCVDKRVRAEETGGPYLLIGNVNFRVEPASRAVALLTLLTAKNHPATLSFVESAKKPGQCRLDISKGRWD